MAFNRFTPLWINTPHTLELVFPHHGKRSQNM